MLSGVVIVIASTIAITFTIGLFPAFMSTPKTMVLLRDCRGITFGSEPHSWFMGYGPHDEPEIAFVVVVEAGGHGSDVAVPIAKQLLFTYLGRTGGAT